MLNLELFMKMREIELLKENDFQGFKTIGELMGNHSMIPSNSGVYVCLRIKDTKPEFLTKGCGGFYKRLEPKDPNVSIAELEANWVEGTSIVYIGKTTNLKTRLRAYLRFGEGKFSSHWGGRYIWQLKDSKDLIVCWKTIEENPRNLENQMIIEFKATHNGQRPFANLQD